ncbi:MAG: hypothetical protein G01um101433_32 [Parcubacteria group bacterium Gr01-1014_33]|nr:MAG: hypothetical protein G01um101433_32 [Parcubacteria group bacterium Gr01-1014_33]
MESGENGIRKLVIAGILFFIVGFGVSWFIFGRGRWGMPASEEKQTQESTEASSLNESASGAASLNSETSQMPSSQTPPAPANPPQATGMISSGKNSVSVSDQVQGHTVKVESVSLEKTAWVVIHEDREGKPGNILGAHRFPAGSGSGEVELLRDTAEGKVYYAMIHTDDGDGTFDYKKDVPLAGSSGAPLMVKFTATASAHIQ